MSKNLFSVDTKVLQNKHLKMALVQQGSDIKLEAIAFNMIEKEHLVAAGVSFSAAYTIETNSYRNKKTIQLMIKDIK